MATTRLPGSANAFFVGVLLIGITALLISEHASNADEVPAFFLKIAKNIPRVGRSDGFDEVFKARKIGGHDAGSQAESWPSYGNNEPFSKPIKRRMDYPSIDDAWSWQHFPLAIEGPRELWRTLAGYSKDGSDDIDNEIWKRKKRTENEAVTFDEK